MYYYKKQFEDQMPKAGQDPYKDMPPGYNPFYPSRMKIIPILVRKQKELGRLKCPKEEDAFRKKFFQDFKEMFPGEL